MKKNVQIPYELFVNLVRHHLFEMDEYSEEIKKAMEKKLDALVMHDLYRKYKTAPTEEEREEARQKYLDQRGVPESFLW